MALDPLHGLHSSCEARCIFAYLHRRGGSVRMGPLLRGLGLEPRIVLHALVALGKVMHDDCVRPRQPANEEARPLTDIYRLCTTRFGRRKYRASWPVD